MGALNDHLFKSFWQHLAVAGALGLAVVVPVHSAGKPTQQTSLEGSAASGYETLIKNSHRFHLVSPEEVAPRGIVEALVGAEVIDSTGGTVGEVEAIVMDTHTGRVGLVLTLAGLDSDEARPHLLAPITEIAILGDYLVWQRADDFSSQDIRV